MSQRIQTYMDKHRIGPMFEDLMNKVLRDMPDDPVLYLLKALYKKAGLEIPKEVRTGGMRKSMSDLTVSRSPERSQKGFANSSADAAMIARSYERPWAHHAKRIKPKKSGEEAETSKSVKRPLHKTDWNSDNRVKTTSFDELWEGHRSRKDEAHHQRANTISDSRNAWASVGLDDDGKNNYSSSGYTGPRNRVAQDDDLLASEIPVSSSSYRQQKQENHVVKDAHVRGPKIDSRKHKHDLEKLLRDSDSSSRDSGFIQEADEDDPAIEMLEDADELLREGVTNIPSSGYKLSRVMRQRKEDGPHVKLNIKTYTTSADERYGELEGFGQYDSDQDERPPTARSGRQSVLDTDDEFESVSQVTGPRRPVWGFPADSDGDSYIPKPSYTSQQPQRSAGRTKQAEKKLASTMPVRFTQPYNSQSIESAGDFAARARKTWAPDLSSDEERQSPSPVDVQASFKSEQGGWLVPEDSDAASVTDWNQRVKGKTRRDPRAY